MLDAGRAWRLWAKKVNSLYNGRGHLLGELPALHKRSMPLLSICLGLQLKTKTLRQLVLGLYAASSLL